MKTNIVYIVNLPPLRVLLVEDDPLAQHFMNRIVGRLGMEVALEQVASAEEAFARLRAKTFDLVIADHFLEGNSTGLDLWRHCQASYPSSGFLLTSSLDPELVRKLSFREDAGPAYLQKPFPPETVQNLIKSLLE